MTSFRRLVSSEPLGIFAIAWPVVFLAPLVPGLPKAWLSSLSWRQEFAIALLLIVTLTLLLKQTARVVCLHRGELSALLPLTLFLAWSATSLIWAKGTLHALHYNLTWASYLICFVLMLRIAASPRLLRASLTSLATVISIVSIASALEFWSVSPEAYQFALILRRSTGLGEPFAVAVPLFGLLAITVRKRRVAWCCGITTVLAWLATLQSLERAPLLGASAGLLVIIAGLIVQKAWRPRYPRRALAVVILLVAATAFQTLAPGIGSSFRRFKQMNDKDPNTRVRLLTWSIGLEMFREEKVHGVGANNFELAYPEARAEFSARHADSSLVGQQEDFLAQRAHNEYVQILAELGLVGFTIFLMFGVALIRLAIKALRAARNPLALGSVSSLVTFAVSSGASSVSFRWLSSGLLFFFVAAIMIRFAARASEREREINIAPALLSTVSLAAMAISIVMLCGVGALGMAAMLRGMAIAQSSSLTANPDSSRDSATEHLFRSALKWNPYDGPTRFAFGLWLNGKHRNREAVDHLRFATENGFNSSTCYAFLAAAEASAGDSRASEQTLARALRIYPRSVFLRVRHSIALAEAGNPAAADHEYQEALASNAPEARGWRQLMCFGPDSAYAAARENENILPPKKLEPESWAYPAILEQAARPPFAYPADGPPQIAN